MAAVHKHLDESKQRGGKRAASACLRTLYCRVKRAGPSTPATARDSAGAGGAVRTQVRRVTCAQDGTGVHTCTKANCGCGGQRAIAWCQICRVPGWKQGTRTGAHLCVEAVRKEKGAHFEGETAQTPADTTDMSVCVCVVVVVSVLLRGCGVRTVATLQRVMARRTVPSIVHQLTTVFPQNEM